MCVYILWFFGVRVLCVWSLCDRALVCVHVHLVVCLIDSLRLPFVLSVSLWLVCLFVCAHLFACLLVSLFVCLFVL